MLALLTFLRNKVAATDVPRFLRQTDGVEPGLKPGGKVLTVSGVRAGPFTEAREVISGYMVVVAENYDRALEVARECPGVLGPGSSVEIREIARP
jgi:hypothetical protein